MKKLQIFTICCLSTFVIGYSILQACGYYEEDYTSIFAPEIVGDEDSEYFRELYSSIKIGEYDHINHFKDDNTNYWYDFFEKKIDKQDLN